MNDGRHKCREGKDRFFLRIAKEERRRRKRREDERKCTGTLEIIAEVAAAVKWEDNGLSFISCQFSNDSSRQDICLSTSERAHSHLLFCIHSNRGRLGKTSWKRP